MNAIEAWEKLEKNGQIFNFTRKNDTRRYIAQLINGAIKVECNRGRTQYMTIDTFLYLFLEGLPYESGNSDLIL